MKKDILLLDLGSFELKGMYFDEKSNQILYSKSKDTGISNGYVVDVFLFQTGILNVIKEIEEIIHKKIVNIVLLISGQLLQYKTLSVGNLKINGVINQNKIELIDKHIKQWVEEKQSVLLKSTPIEYVLDDAIVENPYGLYTEIFSFKYFICYALKSKVNNLIYVLEQLNLNVIDFIPSIFLLGEKYLSRDEKELGSLIFDIGHSKIHWAFYYKGVPLKACNINLGSKILTNKLARSLKISLKDASKIKNEHLSAFLKPDHFCSWVKIVHDSNEEFILQAEVIRKVLPEIEELIAEIKSVLEIFSKQNPKAFSVVFCGNGAILKDFIEVLQKGSSLSFKIEKADSIFAIADKFFQKYKINNTSSKVYQAIKRFFEYFFD